MDFFQKSVKYKWLLRGKKKREEINLTKSTGNEKNICFIYEVESNDR